MELDDYAAMSFEDIATKTGMTLHAVRKHYQNAMKKIKRNPAAIYELKRACAMARGERG